MNVPPRSNRMTSQYQVPTNKAASERLRLKPMATMLLLVATCFLAGRAAADPPGWIASWQGTPTPGGTFYSPGCPSDVGLNNQTIRNVVHLSLGGDWLRVRLSNNAGSNPLAVGAASLALAGTGAASGGSLYPLHFNGATSILIAAGGEVLSDPVPLHVSDGTNLDVSVYLPGATGPSTQHYFAAQDNYLAAGDQTGSAMAGPFATTISCWMFLSSVDVVTSPRVKGTLVAYGDSITDGYLSTTNANHGYPDDLAVRFASRNGVTLAVVNAGIIGNELLTIRPQLEFGYTAPARFARDALIQPGAKVVLLLEGINDIGDRSAKAADLIPVYEQMIRQAHDVGLKIFGATLTPFAGSNAVYGGDYGTPAGEAERQKVNAWIRTSGAFDGVVDFDKAVRDPADPTRLLPAYDADHLHPNDAGYQAMANAVNIKSILEAID